MDRAPAAVLLGSCFIRAWKSSLRGFGSRLTWRAGSDRMAAQPGRKRFEFFPADVENYTRRIGDFRSAAAGGARTMKPRVWLVTEYQEAPGPERKTSQTAWGGMSVPA